jgi:hypothetical protein
MLTYSDWLKSEKGLTQEEIDTLFLDLGNNLVLFKEYKETTRDAIRT